jgi:O-antigen ligase
MARVRHGERGWIGGRVTMSRRVVAGLVGGAGVIMGVASVGPAVVTPPAVLLAPHGESRAAPGTVASPTGGLAGPPAVLGVNVDLVGQDAAAVERASARLSGGGVGYVRLPVRWTAIEASRGHYDWTGLDPVVATLARHGLQVLVTLETAPDWARGDPTPEPHLFLCRDPVATDPSRVDAAPATDPTDLAAFAVRLVERYSGRIWALEVWREPNLLPNWRRTGPDPEDYARTLATVADAVHRAAPAVHVVSAALAPTTDVGVCFMSDVVFLDRLARTGVLTAVDAVGIEPLGLRSPPPALPTDGDGLNFARATVLHDVLVRHAVDRSLWALAWGWSAGGVGTPSPWGNHAPETAAAWLRDGYALARTGWPWMGPMFVWHDQPRAPSGDPIWGFALSDAAGRPTLLWDTVADLARADPAALRATVLTGTRAVPGQGGAGAPALGDAWVLALVAVAAVALAWAARGRLAPVLRAALGNGERLGSPLAIGAFALLVAINVMAPGPIGFGALAALVVLAAARPDLAVAGVALAAPFDAVMPMRLGSHPVWPVELLVAVALGGRALAVYASLVPRRTDDRAPRHVEVPRWHVPGVLVNRARQARGVLAGLDALDWTAIALVAWSALTPLWAEHAAAAVREWRTVILGPVLYYGLLRTAPDRRRAARAALYGLVAGGVIASVWAVAGLGLHMTGHTGAAVAAEGVVRATGPYRSPNNLALFLGRMLPVLAALALWGTPRRRRVCVLVAVPIGLALLLTFSRGAFVLGVPVVAIFLLLAGSERVRHAGWRRALAPVAIGLGVGVAVLLPFADTPRVRDTFSPRPGSTLFIRLRLWQSAVEMGRDHPILGVGLDNFLYLYRDRYVKRDAAQERFLSHPHNVLLDWWTRLGIPGLAILTVLVAGQVRALRRALRGTRGDRGFVVAAAGAQLYALTHGMVDNSFFLVDLAIVWWTAQAQLLAGAGHGNRAGAAAEAAGVGPPGFEPGIERL